MVAEVRAALLVVADDVVEFGADGDGEAGEVGLAEFLDALLEVLLLVDEVGLGIVDVGEAEGPEEEVEAGCEDAEHGGGDDGEDLPLPEGGVRGEGSRGRG